jgi:hypothetical protein
MRWPALQLMQNYRLLEKFGDKRLTKKISEIQHLLVEE